MQLCQVFHDLLHKLLILILPLTALIVIDLIVPDNDSFSAFKL